MIKTLLSVAFKTNASVTKDKFIKIAIEKQENISLVVK